MTSQKRKEKQELHTNCPLLTLSRHDCDTAVTHVSVSPQSWKSPPTPASQELSLCFVLPTCSLPWVRLSSDRVDGLKRFCVNAGVLGPGEIQPPALPQDLLFDF